MNEQSSTPPAERKLHKQQTWRKSNSMNKKGVEKPANWEEYLHEIAAATLKKGGTAFKLDRCQFLPPMDIWSFPKYPGRTRILPQTIELVDALRDFITANEKLLKESDCWLGTWINPITHEFYLDIATGQQDLEAAKREALEASQRDGRRIVAIYNSQQQKTIYL